ncbi:MAG: hypothetical protein J7501_14905, partial [Bdellovibrio sp.]|nr:hypothetical protein [Bdellovibrio sp.]
MNSWTKKALILALVAGSLSCMKQPELDDEITPASLEEVQNALVDGWGSVSPLTMLKKDFIYQETEQQLDSYEPRLALQEGITITD